MTMKKTCFSINKVSEPTITDLFPELALQELQLLALLATQLLGFVSGHPHSH